jgi:aldehyde dehydrogenase (NAD+)
VAEAAGGRLIPCKLELGGKGAAVIFDDVDPTHVAEQMTNAITLNTGQVCCTATRWLVQDAIYDRFVADAQRLLGSVRMGRQLDATTQMGPAVSEKQRDRILDYLKRGTGEGASLLFGDAHPETGDGYFIAPALLAGNHENICAREEVFGPVAFLIRFSDEADAIEIVNSSRYGLANSVWSTNAERATRVAEALVAGNSWINAHNVFVHGIPYGGVNLSGLGGGVLGEETFTDYLRAQSIVRP